MRKTLFVFFIVLLSVAWVAAQQSDSGPGSASGQSSSSGAPPQSTPDKGQSASPTAPPDTQANPPSGAAGAGQSSPGNSQMIEGCLGGTAPDFTLTDQTGTVYKLDIPKDADTSQLTAHIGESVRVRGTMSGAGASDSASTDSKGSSASGSATAGQATADSAKPDNKPSGSASAAASQSIQVEQMSRGAGTCPVVGPKPSGK